MATGGEREEVFRTVIQPREYPFKIALHDKLSLMGSCFSTNIGERLRELKFDIDINPFGISYSPLSLAWGLGRLADPAPFSEADLSFADGRHFSFQHHTQFSDASQEACLGAINSAHLRARCHLSESKVLFLTLGSSWTFFLAETGTAVANCHRRPAKLFNRRLVEASESAEALAKALAPWLASNPSLNVVVTVSPVRHWKDGAVENSLSKSHLVVAAHTLARMLPQRVHYFESFELVMDDLRDYRFFAADMLHPSPAAVDYIFATWRRAFLHPESHPTLQDLAAIRAACAHRPRDPASTSHAAFVRNTLEAIDTLVQRQPHMDFAAERAQLLASLFAGP